MSNRRYFNRCKMISAVADASKNKGTPYINMMFKVLEGPEAGATKYYVGYLTEATAESTVRVLKESGWTGKDFTDFSGIGTYVQTLVEQDEEYEGKSRPQIKFVNPYRDRPMKARNAPPPNELSKFKALIKATTVDLKGARIAPSADDIASLGTTDHTGDSDVEPSPF